LYASPNIIRMIKSRRMRWAGHVVRMGAMRSAYKILVGKLEGTSRHRRRICENNIRMYLRVIGWEVVHWIYVAQDKDRWRALVNALMNLRVPYSAGNFSATDGCSIDLL
jgi:hypothetical protein